MFNKPTKQEKPEMDEYQRLMCTYPGCTDRWAVHQDGDKPKCSKHQWQAVKRGTSAAEQFQ